MKISNEKAITDGLYLFSLSAEHSKYYVSDLTNYLIYPVKNNMIRLYYSGEKPIGLITWAFLSEDKVPPFLNMKYKLQEDDYQYNSNKMLWGIEFIAPFGHAKKLMSAIRQEHKITYPEHKDVYWRRLYDPSKLHKRKF